MAFPVFSRTQSFVCARESEPPHRLVDLPLLESSKEVESNQHVFLRGKPDRETHAAWFITEGTVPVAADTLLLAHQRIMRKAGTIIRESPHTGEVRFLAKFLDSYQTSTFNAPNIDIPLEIAKVDCVVLEDGRVFFVNGTHDNYRALALSLNIPVNF